MRKQTTSDEYRKAINNKSVPIGLIDTSFKILDELGIAKLLNSYKVKGEKLSPIVAAMMVHSLFEDNSMKACAKWVSEPKIRKIFGFKKAVSQRTINRALVMLGVHREEILIELHKGLESVFPELDKDIYADGSAVLMNKESDISKRGYSRDNNPDGLQVEFMLGMYAESRIPFYIREFRGNASDEEMYSTSLPEMIGLMDKNDINAFRSISNKLLSGIKDRNQERELRKLEKRSKKGRIPTKKEQQTSVPDKDEAAEYLLDINRKLGNASFVIFDNGGASVYNTEAVKQMGHEYLTRKSMNASDMELVSKSEGEVVEPGLVCWSETFESSGRTKYIFRSDELAEAKRDAAKRKVDRMAEVAKALMNGEIDKHSLVEVKNNQFIEFTVDVHIQSILFDYSEEEKANLVNEYLGNRPGFFHLESSTPLTAEKAIRMYRKRVAVEHAIKSLKNLSGIKPMRVISKGSIAGQMTLALLVETSMSIIRYQYPSDTVKVTRKGISTYKEHKPDNNSICKYLTSLTAVYYVDEKGHTARVLSGITPESIGIIERLEAKFTKKTTLDSFSVAG